MKLAKGESIEIIILQNQYDQECHILNIAWSELLNQLNHSWNVGVFSFVSEMNLL